jgi:energy-coupling factor transporter ATP-binding protein EcfA2
MLTRIEIDGFKTFQDFALDVPPFLVVIGPNAAGKSNLFDAIAFLARLAQGATVRQAVREARGQLTGLLHRDSTGGQVQQMRFAVDLGWPGVRQQVRYELERGVAYEPEDPRGTQSVVIDAERFYTREAGQADSPWRQAEYTPVWEPEDNDRSGPYPASRAFRVASRPLSRVVGAARSRGASGDRQQPLARPALRATPGKCPGGGDPAAAGLHRPPVAEGHCPGSREGVGKRDHEHRGD